MSLPRPEVRRRPASQAVLFWLLAGLGGLAMSFPAPTFLRAAFCDAPGVPSEDQDPLPGDRDLPEGESCSDDVGLPAPARRRLSPLSGPDRCNAPRVFWAWTVLSGAQPRPWWLIRFDSGSDRPGHFLAAGRALLCWFQSQVC